MPSGVSAALDVASGAVVALFAISKVYRLTMVWLVRTSPTDMIVEERLEGFEVRRGEARSSSGSTRLRGGTPSLADSGSTKWAGIEDDTSKEH